MDPQQLLATLIQLSDEQQHRIAELLNRLEQQTRTLTTASQRAAQAANALDHNGQKTALHLQAAVQQSVETTLHDTLTTLSQRAECHLQKWLRLFTEAVATGVRWITISRRRCDFSQKALRLAGNATPSLRPAQLDEPESSHVARPEGSRGRRRQAMGDPAESTTASTPLVAIAEPFE